MSNRRLEKTLNGNERKEVKDITIQENIQKLQKQKVAKFENKGKINDN